MRSRMNLRLFETEPAGGQGTGGNGDGGQETPVVTEIREIPEQRLVLNRQMKLRMRGRIERNSPH